MQDHICMLCQQGLPWTKFHNPTRFCRQRSPFDILWYRKDPKKNVLQWGVTRSNSPKCCPNVSKTVVWYLRTCKKTHRIWRIAACITYTMLSQGTETPKAITSRENDKPGRGIMELRLEPLIWLLFSCCNWPHFLKVLSLHDLHLLVSCSRKISIPRQKAPIPGNRPLL